MNSDKKLTKFYTLKKEAEQGVICLSTFWFAVISIILLVIFSQLFEDFIYNSNNRNGHKLFYIFNQIFPVIFWILVIVMCCSFIFLFVNGITISKQTEKIDDSSIYILAIASIFFGMFTFDILRRKVNKFVDEKCKTNLVDNNSEFIGGINSNYLNNFKTNNDF